MVDYNDILQYAKRYRGRTPIDVNKLFNLPGTGFQLGESGPLVGGKNLPSTRVAYTPNIVKAQPSNIAKAEEIDKLFNKTKDIAKEVGKTGAKASIGKTLATYAPFTSDFVDLGAGIRSVREGHPYVGAGQIALGLGGLGIDTLSALGAPLTGGGSILGGALLKQGGKQLIKQGGKQLLKNAIKLQGGKQLGAVARPIETTLLELLKGNDATDTDNVTPVTTEDTSIKGNITPIPEGDIPSAGLNYDLPPIEQIINQAQAGYTPEGLEAVDINQDIQLPQSGPSSNLQALLDLYKQQVDLTTPYRQGLRDYIDNYKALQRQGQLQDLKSAGWAGWTGNNAFTNMIGRYNPADIEAKKLDLINTLAQSQRADLQGANELVGNVALAEQAGLPSEAAFANKTLLNTASALGKANISADAKKYYADTITRAKLVDNYYDRELKKAIEAGRQDLAIKIQGMKNTNRIQTAIITGSAFGDLNSLFNTSNLLGVTDIPQSEIPQPIDINSLLK